MKKPIYFATSNENKVREVERILGVPVIRVNLDVDEIQTFDPIECVEKKAILAAQKYGKPVLVEDTTLFFDAWKGLPGVFTTYFLNSVGNEGMIKMLKSEKNRKAKSQTCFAIVRALPKSKNTKTEVDVFVGEVRGTISKKPKGTNGFGWGSIFIPNGLKKTYAQMEGLEKDKYSMRRIALEKFKKSLQHD